MASIKPEFGKQLNWIQHALSRPDVYIGAIETVYSNKWVAIPPQNATSKISIMKLHNFPFNEGFERIHLEQISNAIDNKWRSEKASISMTKITIDIDPSCGETTIYNDGAFIPIELHDFEFKDPNTNQVIQRRKYPQELYFGEWLTSTNYEDEKEDRKTSGRYGMGAKATNVFSSKFIVECGDPQRGLKYVGIYRSNRSIIEEPKITKYRGKKGYTKIVFSPDFKRFGMAGYTEDWISLFRRHACDCAMVTKIPVFFNKHKITLNTLKAYSSLFSCSNSKMVYLATTGYEVVLAEQDENTARSSGFGHISFVNGIHTIEGGIHVEKWKKSFLDDIRDRLNKRFHSGDKNGSSYRLTSRDIEPYFLLFLRCEVDKPVFNSQTKKYLVAPAPPIIKLTPAQLTRVLSWDFSTRLSEKIRQKEELKIKRTESTTSGRRKSLLKLGNKSDPANWAGTKKSSQCTLYVTEGLSAKALAVAGISSIRGGKNVMGVYALKGKPLNAMKSTLVVLNKNEEISNLKRMIGLKSGVDYSDSEEFSKLNYGKMILMCDQDVDGFHISGLILAFMHSQFRSLLERRFVGIINTPLIKVRLPRKKDPIVFYSEIQFKRWQASHKGSKILSTQYCKGLATHTNTDAKQIISDQKILQITTICGEKRNEETQVMNLGFGDKETDERKIWINSYEEDNGDFLNKTPEIAELIEGNLPLPEFVNGRLRSYHVTNMRRSLPHVIDGLKEGQRKILYGCFLRNLTKEPIKVAQLSGYISEHTGYHHGEESLHKTIIGMAQGFVGSNNIPLLTNDGQFGTRLEGGEDRGAPRYIFTKLDPMTRLIFRPEDDELLTRVIDDNEVFEPTFYVPIIPLILINKACGIGTGYSTNIPSYNPKDIVVWIMAWIENQKNPSSVEYPELVPWWRGFTGKIILTRSGALTEGIFRIVDSRTLQISELPIGLWTSKFKIWLEGIKWVKNYHNNSGTNTVNIDVFLSEDYGPEIEKEFRKLRTKISMTNMVALDRKRKGKKYEDVEAILNEFCSVRYNLYIDRKKKVLEKLSLSLQKDQNKHRFLNEVIVSRTIELYQKEKEEIEKELEIKKYNQIDQSYDYLLNLPFSSLTKARIEALQNSIENLKQRILTLKSKTEYDLWEDDLDDFLEGYYRFLTLRID